MLAPNLPSDLTYILRSICYDNRRSFFSQVINHVYASIQV